MGYKYSILMKNKSDNNLWVDSFGHSYFIPVLFRFLMAVIKYEIVVFEVRK